MRDKILQCVYSTQKTVQNMINLIAL